eukprot:TRINITY_DN47134_c0_g1_i1.p1 TRINITY_DN47134_c0_g1~~TRINITY_DN47134_c0_g1_i1.p1  ORF type:complete len:381 (+),score=110.20 TRINITY_DN47134_c0_g1_i1:87-1145(+)
MATADDGMSDLFRQYHQDYILSGGTVGKAVARLAEGTYRLVARGPPWTIRTAPGGQGQPAGECDPGAERRVMGRDGEWLQLSSREWVRAVQPSGRWVPVSLALAGGERDDALREARKELDCAEAALGDMDRELSECSAAARGELKRRLVVLRDECRRLAADLKATRSLQAECDRQALLAQDEAVADDSGATDQRARLMSETCDALGERAKGISRHTDRILQMTVETAETGQHSLMELRRQREVIGRAQGHVDETNTELSRARAVISRMHKRALKNKALLWLIIAFLVSMIAIVVYFSLRPSSAGAPPPPGPVVVQAPPPVVDVPPAMGTVVVPATAAPAPPSAAVPSAGPVP